MVTPESDETPSSCLAKCIESPCYSGMTLYHSLLRSEQHSDAHFLGKIPLEPCPSGGVQTDVPQNSRRVGENGTVEAPWNDPDNSTVHLPDAVDTTDPFQLAPMASHCNRPIPHPSTFESQYETAHVFETAIEPETEIQDIDAVEYRESVIESSENGKLKKMDRWYEWDDTVVDPSVVADSPPEHSETTYLVGFHDGQDMHDPYTHLGVSAADTAPGAIRDVLDRISGIPLWRPKAYRVKEHREYPASDVFAGVGEAYPSHAESAR